MSQQGPATLDCKIKVRKYVLVANPSRWGQKVDRAVVQSPMLEINKRVSRVPVKRNKGEEQNAVDFLTKNDIEKDSCVIYTKLYVKKDPFEVDAHGVALLNKSSRPCEATLDFKRGDRFWICVGANTQDYQTTVPVINLRTYELGTVPINSVCWFPRIEGPDGELWTLGGEIRKLKQTGVRKFSYWSWVICQRLDGGASVTKSVQIPASYVTKDTDESVLSAAASQLLFEKRRALMLEEGADDPCNEDSVNTEERAASILPTPPISPESTTSKSSVEGTHATQANEAVVSPDVANQADEAVISPDVDTASPQMQALKRVLAHACSPPRLKRLKPSPIHLELRVDITPEAQMSPKLLGKILDNLPEEPWKASNRDISDERSFTQRSQTETVTQARGSKPTTQPPATLPYNNQLELPPNKCTLAEGDTYDVYYARRKKELATGGLLPSDRIHNASLCDLGDETCQFSQHCTIPHFHAPPEKCVLDSRIYTLSSGKSKGSGHSAGKPTTHEHCIYRQAGRPDTCVQEGWKHQCCYWSEEDRIAAAIPPTSASEVDNLPKVYGEVVDRRSAVNLHQSIVAFEDVGLDIEYLDECGKSFFKELEAGGFDEEDLMEGSVTDSSTSQEMIGDQWNLW